MSAERTPQTDDSLLAAPLAFITRCVVRFPLVVVVGGILLAVLSLAFTARHLGFHTSRLDLLNPGSGFNKLWMDYIQEFGDADDTVIVVEGPNREHVVPVLKTLSHQLQGEPRLFHSVLHEVDLSRIRAKGLHYLSSDELLEIERSLDDVDPVLRGDWSQLNVGKMFAASAAPDSNDPRAERRVARLPHLSESLASAIIEGRYQSPWNTANKRLTRLSEIGPEYLLTNEGQLGFVLLRLSDDDGQFARGSNAIDRLRELIAKAQRQHPDTTIGLTGLPVMENDEMRASQRDMLKASVISLFGVACLFIAGFGGVRHPLITVLALIIAMAWSFGYVTLMVGHLNILSVSFGVILIGLGIDFGIHYVARYLLLRRQSLSCAAALENTARSVGPGIVTGGVTTAIAFFTAILTDFTGIAELGAIAGGGILLCLVAALLLLPAMIHLSERGSPATTAAEPLHVQSWVAPLLAYPRFMFVAMLGLSAAAALGLSNLKYDHNLLNLQPEGVESVELEQKLLMETDHSVWYALSIAGSREELLERKERFLKMASVDRTEEIVSLLPADHETKSPVIARIHSRLQQLPQRPPQIPVAPPEELGRALALTQSRLPDDDTRLRTARRQLEEIRNQLRRMEPREVYQRTSDYQQHLAGDLLNQLHLLQSLSTPEPPTLDDLPPGLVKRFVGRNNRHLLKIYGRGNIWDMQTLERFVADVKRIDPAATGQPVQAYFASRQMQRSYLVSALYALIAVAAVLMIDFWSLRMTLLALLPVSLGMVQLFGVMGLLDIPLNPANLIVLPLILGIGIDDGVHVVHDFKRQAGRYRLSSSTATAVLITSLTTMVGFGSLMLASHRGLQSLGRVLTIGVGCCLLTSLVMLPALLSWMSAQRGAEEDDADADEETIAPRRRAA